MRIGEILEFLGVGLLWGVTNPLIKRGSNGIQASTQSANNKFYHFFLELIFLILRWQYIVPFLLNQCGSILYVFALQNSDISLAVPITQSTTFLFTTLTALGLREQMPNIQSFIGIVFILIGINICVYSKL